jgi:S-adenosylmethionine decarboxylase
VKRNESNNRRYCAFIILKAQPTLDNKYPLKFIMIDVKTSKTFSNDVINTQLAQKKVQEAEVALAVTDHQNKSCSHNNSKEISDQVAGKHYIVDLYGASFLTDIVLMEKALIDAAHVAGATLLHIHLHKFTEGGGITGVALLAESHISVHSWPERNYAAFDVFMCGNAQPQKAVELLEQVFLPERVEVKEILRGEM